ncbi:MAG: hypothetical protein ACC628_13255, partial [Pirellulaceae bacterium]
MIAEKERPRADVFWSGDPVRAAILKSKGLSPSFLPCIGWSNLAAAKWLWWLPTPDGLAGCVFV